MLFNILFIKNGNEKSDSQDIMPALGFCFQKCRMKLSGSQLIFLIVIRSLISGICHCRAPKWYCRSVEGLFWSGVRYCLAGMFHCSVAIQKFLIIRSSCRVGILYALVCAEGCLADEGYFIADEIYFLADEGTSVSSVFKQKPLKSALILGVSLKDCLNLI